MRKERWSFPAIRTPVPALKDRQIDAMSFSWSRLMKKLADSQEISSARVTRAALRQNPRQPPFQSIMDEGQFDLCGMAFQACRYL